MLSLKKKLTSGSGFSLIEAIIATAVLASVLVGLASLLTFTSRSTTQARNRVIAGELAQEGIDFLRQERNILHFNGLQQILSDGDSFCLDDTSSFSQSVSDNVFDDFDDADACDYEIDMGTDVLFKRTAEVVDQDADLIIIEVVVFWMAEGVRETSVDAQIKIMNR